MSVCPPVRMNAEVLKTIRATIQPSSYSFRDLSVHPDRRTWLDRLG